MAVQEYKLGQDFSSVYDDIENCKIVQPWYRQGISQDVFSIEKRNPLVITSHPVELSDVLKTNIVIIDFAEILNVKYYLVTYILSDWWSYIKKVCLCYDNWTNIVPVSSSATNHALFDPKLTCRRLYKFFTTTWTQLSSGVITTFAGAEYPYRVFTEPLPEIKNKYLVTVTWETFVTKAVKGKYIYFTDANGAWLTAEILDYWWAAHDSQTSIYIDLDYSSCLLEPQILAWAAYVIWSTKSYWLYWWTQSWIRTFHPWWAIWVLPFTRIVWNVYDMLQIKWKTLVLYELSWRTRLECSTINTNWILIFWNPASVMHKQLYSQDEKLLNIIEICQIEDYILMWWPYWFLLCLLTIKLWNLDSTKWTITYDEHQVRVKELSSTLWILQKGCMTSFKNWWYIVSSNKYFYWITITTSWSWEDYSLDLSEQWRFVRSKLSEINRYCKLYIEDEMIHIFYSKNWELCDIDTAETYEVQYDFYYKWWLSQKYKKPLSGIYYSLWVKYYMLDNIYSEWPYSTVTEFSSWGTALPYTQTVKLVHWETTSFNLKMFNYVKISLWLSSLVDNELELSLQYHVNWSIYEIEDGITASHFINSILSNQTKWSDEYWDRLYEWELVYDSWNVNSWWYWTIASVIKPINKPWSLLKVIISSDKRFIYWWLLVSDTVLKASVTEPALYF